MILIDANGNRTEITEKEYKLLIDAANVWNKESHLAEINALYEAEFNKRLTDADYVGRWELNAVLADPANEYYQEAKSIIAYWWDGWDAIKAYAETVTEETALTPEQWLENNK